MAKENGNGNGALDLLMDMELPVMVRFGSTRLPLRDLMKLNVGSVVELDRTPDPPVEVLVNGKVIARGSAVVVQGNYGVKIAEVAATREGLLPASPGRNPRP